MSVKITKNHVRVEETSEHTRLGISRYLYQQLGSDVRFTWVEPGTRVDGGGRIGRVDGGEQGCSLYAPFSLEVLQVKETEVDVRRLEAPIEDLLTEDEYAALVS
jgi:glycine cleavage system H lipoate-binding protein